jgi:hypothetical protein
MFLAWAWLSDGKNASDAASFLGCQDQRQQGS